MQMLFKKILTLLAKGLDVNPMPTDLVAPVWQ